MKKDVLIFTRNAIISLLFWLAVWEISALIIDFGFIFPRVGETLSALRSMIFTAVFWKSVSFSLLRVIYGFLLGVVIGILSAFLSFKFSVINIIISPAVTAIKSTPVASIIMLLWFIIGGDTVPIAIAVLMVAPIIWQSTMDGLASIDKELSEVCTVFKTSYIRRLKILILPSVLKYLLPALISASGLAWKSGIAAEIITYTESSIGRIIINSKLYDQATMFAMTIVVILLSIIIEKLIKISVRTVMKKWH